jgi:hypothetical protein
MPVYSVVHTYVIYNGIGVEGMKGLVRFAACSAAMFFGCAGVADAADIDTLVAKAPVVQAPPPASCASIQGFFLTACQLSWYGVRFYGTIDVGSATRPTGRR